MRPGAERVHRHDLVPLLARGGLAQLERPSADAPIPPLARTPSQKENKQTVHRLSGVDTIPCHPRRTDRPSVSFFLVAACVSREGTGGGGGEAVSRSTAERKLEAPLHASWSCLAKPPR